MLQIKNVHDIDQWLSMHGSTALGASLVKNGKFAADILAFDAGQKTEPHTHPGNHILFVVEGEGWLIFNGQHYILTPATCYFVPGLTVHQVGSDSNMLLLSIADDHRPVDSAQRLEVIYD
jgi:quercetin dioxygenase-like cupin family protein